MKKVAVALLLEVPDGTDVTSNQYQWQKILNGGNDFTRHPVFGDMTTYVKNVEIHTDPEAIFNSTEGI